MAILDQYKTIQQQIADKKNAQFQEKTLAERQAILAGTQPLEQPAPVAPTPTPEPVTTPAITPAPAQTPAPAPSVNVTGYTDNPDGTTTNTLSDGTKSTVSYSNNPNGGLTPTEVSPNAKANGMVDTGYVNSNQFKLDQANLNKLNSNLSIYSTGKALYDGVQGGSILPGTKEFTDLTTRNPQVLADYNLIKADKVKTETVKALGQSIVGDPIVTKPSNALEQLVSFFTKSMDTDVATEYQNSVINNPAYQASIQNMNGINQQIADNNKNINALREDVRQKYSAGTPESLIASAIAREARPLIEQGQYLAQLQENAQSEMTRLFEENKQVFDLKQEEITNNRNIALQLYGTIRAEEIRQEDIIREDERLQAEMEQAKTEQEYLQLKDERDFNFKVAEAMQKSGQWEADYNLKLAEAGKTKASDYLKFEVENEDGSKSTIYRNPTTGQEINPAQTFGSQAGNNVDINAVLGGYSKKGQELLSVPDGTVVPTRLGQVSPQNASIRGKECAEYVNDIAGTQMGSTYKSKTDICNETSGGIGSIVAWQPNGSGQYGHTGIKVGEDDKYEYIKSSNYVPGTVTTEAIPKGTIKNYYTPESVKQIQKNTEPTAKRYANGNVRTADGTLYTNKEVSAINKDIIKNDNYKAILTSQDLNDKLSQFEEAFEKYGTEVGLDKLKFNRTGATALQNTYTSLLLTAKEFFNLGVLNGPDLAILTAGMPSPVDFELPSEGGNVTKINGTFLNSKVEEGIRQMREMINQKLKRDYNTVSQSFGEFGDTLPALKNARDVYESFSPEMDEVDAYLNNQD